MKPVRYFLLICSIISLCLNGIMYFFIEGKQEIDLTFFYYFNLCSVLFYITIFYCIIKIGGAVSIHSIIHFLLLLFIYGRPILYIFSPEPDFFESEMLDYEYIGSYNIAISIICANCFAASVNLVYALYGKSDSINANKNELKEDAWLRNMIYKAMVFFSFLYGFKLILEFKYILTVGYIDIYIGGLSGVNYYSFLIQYAHVVFLGLFSYYLTQKPPKKQFAVIAGIYSILSLLDSLKGARITFILPVLFIIWYYFSLYKPRINRKIYMRAFLILGCFIVFSLVLKSTRNNEDVEIELNVVKSALLETGSTIHVVGRYVKHRDEFKDNGTFILEPILYPYYYFRYFDIMTKGQSEEMLQYRNSLNHQLTAKLDKNAYLAGRGVGSSIVAEFYQYGIIVLILFSMLYAGFLLFVYKYIKTPLGIFLSSTVVIHLFFISRDTAFPNLIGIIKSIFVFLLLRILFFGIKQLRKYLLNGQNRKKFANSF